MMRSDTRASPPGSSGACRKRQVALQRFHRLAFGVSMLLLGGLQPGCATSRGILDVRAQTVANPARGPAVKIVRVTDRRMFEVAPSDPSVPSLKDRQINNTAITSRAIARKRNSYGKALGDILLPEGRTVEQVVDEALSRGLSESGFRVLRAGDPGYDEAVPLEAEISQFWAWISPGFWAMHLEFVSRVRLTGLMKPFEDGEEFRGYVRLASGAPSTHAWLNTINKGLDSLNQDMTTRLKGIAGASPPVARPGDGSSEGALR